MQIAQVMAGYSLGEADLLRRAMARRSARRWNSSASALCPERPSANLAWQADTIFELLAKFADYGFNKSHAAAYAMVSYHTAYMKTHYPVEFLAASMTLDINNTDKLSEFRAEVQRLGSSSRRRRSIVPAPPSRSTTASSITRWRPERRRPAGGGTDRGSAQGGLFTSLADFARG